MQPARRALSYAPECTHWVRSGDGARVPRRAERAVHEGEQLPAFEKAEDLVQKHRRVLCFCRAAAAAVAVTARLCLPAGSSCRDSVDGISRTYS